MYYRQVEVKVRDRIAAVIWDIVGRSGRHFSVSCGDIISKQCSGCDDDDDGDDDDDDEPMFGTPTFIASLVDYCSAI